MDCSTSCSLRNGDRPSSQFWRPRFFSVNTCPRTGSSFGGPKRLRLVLGPECGLTSMVN
jgi:hypothetical protein